MCVCMCVFVCVFVPRVKAYSFAQIKIKIESTNNLVFK